MSKNENIKNSIKETRQRRQNMDCKVFELKIDYSHLSKQQKEYLKRLFLEKKWLRNALLADFSKHDRSEKFVSVDIKVKDQFETREINCLSSQIKQDVYDEIKTNIFALARSKKKDNKIGKLKFVSECNMVNLRQYGCTYKFANNRLKIQGNKKLFKINGLKQIPINSEFANAKLIRKPSGYYVQVTCYIPRKEIKKNGLGIGFDFGIKDNIIDSFGNKYNFKFEETKRLKKASRNSNRHYVKTSKSSRKSNKILKREFEKISNSKKDAKNKFISKLREYEIIAVQNENLSGWKSSKMKGWGKRIQHSIMGGIISDIKKMPQTVIINRWFPSTKTCPVCGLVNTIPLTERTYKCECGYVADRDIKSAITILYKAIKQVGEYNLNLQESFITDLLSNDSRLNNLVDSRSQAL